MATYVIGDVQGCFESLMALVSAIDFDESRDELWFVGDLVNRGPDNVGVLRFVRSLGDRATVVLGNHDLHLLARAAGISPRKDLDTIEDVLAADDCDQLVDWLRRQPVVVVRDDAYLVHAGFLPSWTDETIRDSAAALSSALSGPNWHVPLTSIATDRATGLGRLSAVLQRVRMIDSNEEVVSYSGAPQSAPAATTPWFEGAHRRDAKRRVYFGHWSALGLLIRDDVVCLDTGCVWGRTLTAFCIERQTVRSIANAERG